MMLTSPTPLLSIIMPVYNGAAFIGQSVESLLAQTFTNFELLVVDDGSTDESIPIVEAFNDIRIRVIRNDKNRGIVFSRNRGLGEAKGRYIAPFDADDLAHPHKFEKQIRFLEHHPDYGMVGSWARHIDAAGQPMKSRWKLSARPEEIPALMLFRAYFIQSSVVFRREAIPDGGYTEGFEIGEDYKMYFEVAQKHKTWNLPEYLISYRIHGKSILRSRPLLLEECDRKLYTYFYEPLGIEITPERFACLRHLKNNEPIRDTALMRELGKFLALILSQNRQIGLYPEKILEKVILNRWLKGCYLARRHPGALRYAITHSMMKFILNPIIFGQQKLRSGYSGSPKAQ